jgi:molybdopterin-guanine dinucleotide biosynthesis protein B
MVAIAGRSGSGKTHLIERLVRHFVARGLRVATVKHTHHHDFELDLPGKDSWRHRAAGASETLLVSDRRYALLGDLAKPLELPEILQRVQPADLLLIEGFAELRGLPRIEVFRSFLGARTPGRDDSSLAAIAVPLDDSAELPTGIPCLDLDDTAVIADFILHLPLASTVPATRRRGPAARLTHLHSR